MPAPSPAFDISNPFEPPRIPDRFLDPRLRWEIPVWPNLRWGPAQIKVLVVCDGNSYDTASGFSLGLALQDAFDPAHPEHPSYARFSFTKAHRRTEATATPGFDNFRFTAGSLDGFDELWLFGVFTGAPYLITDRNLNEPAEIHAFMDRGGACSPWATMKTWAWVYAAASSVCAHAQVVVFKPAAASRHAQSAGRY